MLKIGLHKLAVVVAIAAIGFMAACSSSSSTDDALTHPGDNYMGTMRFDVDPQAGTVDITPVASPWVMTSPKMPGDLAGNIPNVTITSSNASFVGGNTMDFDVTVKWSDATSELNNVRIGVNASQNMDVTLATDDNPACGLPWSACLPANDPAVTYVADSSLDGPVSINRCDMIPQCADMDFVAIHQGCGAVTAHWTLFEATGAGYSFWADLYGDQMSTGDLLLDPRYDEYTASIYLRVFNMDPLDSTYPTENLPTNGVASGEWFYLHYYVDNPGNNKPGSYPITDLVNGPLHIEDTENIGRYTTSGNWWYVGRLNPWTVRFDPAVILMNASDGSGGNGVAKFKTANGTALRVVNSGATAGWNTQNDPYTSSNAMGAFKQITAKFAATYTPKLYPLAGNGMDGFANIDWDVGYVAMMAKTGLPVGTGSALKIAFDTNTIVVGYTTEYTPYMTTDDPGAAVGRSANWPTWCERLPGGGCMTTGQYNNERTYVCIQ